MKRYLLILTLVLTFLANGMAGMQLSAADHAVSIAGEGVNDTHEFFGHPPSVDAAALAVDQHCSECAQSSCDSGHGCANCLAHCGGALLSALPSVLAKATSLPPVHIKTWNVPSVYSSLLRPPRLS